MDYKLLVSKYIAIELLIVSGRSVTRLSWK